MPQPPSPPAASPSPPDPPAQPSGTPAAAAARSTPGASGGAAQLPAPAPARYSGIAETYDAVQARVLAFQLACFQAANPSFKKRSGPPDPAPSATPKKQRTLLSAWILPHRCSTSASSTIVAQVRVLDRTLDRADSTVFDVLGWQGRDVVLGASLGGGTHLRVVPRSQMPHDTMKALHKLAAANAEVLAESYEASSFVEAAFDRGEPRGLEDVALITDGPLKAMACNLEMKAVLMKQLSWGLVSNGGSNKKRQFTLAATDIKASANLTGPDVASRRRLDMRGEPSSIAMQEVIEAMREPSTKLPYWRSGTKHGGAKAVLRELENWLGGMTIDARAGMATSETRGLALTRQALGLEQVDESAQQTRASAPKPRFVLCNGQSRDDGSAAVRWPDAIGCRCGIRRTELVKEHLTPDQLTQRCGPNGRTQRKRKAREEAAAAVAAAAAVEAAKPAGTV